MTEKRFKLVPNIDISYGIFDKEKLEYIVKHLPISCESVVDVLNNQHKTIQQAKELIKKQYDENSDLIKENEQLKQQNEHLFRQIKAFRDDCFIYGDFNGVSTINQLLDDLEDSKELFE